MTGPAETTHSYARIFFVLGVPLTTAVFDPAQEAAANAVKWRCGCQSTGPFRTMLWTCCDLHAYYKYCSSGLDEDTLLPDARPVDLCVKS
jgi:hypothetical protein